MPEMTIQELSLRLRDGKARDGNPPRFALFLGAGASISSRIPGTQAMIRTFREKLEEVWKAEGSREKFEDWLTTRSGWDKKASEYSNLFEAFEPTPRGRARHIEGLVSGKQPSFGYFCLSQLLASGHINAVVTTNFDDLVYEACALWTGVRPRVYAYGTVSGPVRSDADRPSIIKLHGDFLYSRLKNTDPEVAEVDPNMETQFYQLLNDYEMIVVGYGGNDKSIMKLFERVPNDAGLYWCTYRDDISEDVEKLFERDNVFRVRTDGFDGAIDECLHTIGFSLPDLSQTVQRQIKGVMDIISSSGSPHTSNYLSQTEKALTDEQSEEVTSQRRELRNRTAMMIEAVRITYEGDYKKAVELYLELLETEPENVVINHNLGVALQGDERPVEAIEKYKRANELQPNDPLTLNNLGTTLIDVGGLDEAIGVLETAIALDPDSPARYVNLGIALIQNGSHSDAILQFEETMRLTESITLNYETLNSRHAALLGLGRTDEALEFLQRGLDNVDFPPHELLLVNGRLQRMAKAGIKVDQEFFDIVEQALNKLVK